MYIVGEGDVDLRLVLRLAEFRKELNKLEQLIKKAEARKINIEARVKQPKGGIVDQYGRPPSVRPTPTGGVVTDTTGTASEDIKKETKAQKEATDAKNKAAKSVQQYQESQAKLNKSLDTAIGKLIRYRIAFAAMQAVYRGFTDSLKTFIDINYRLAQIEKVLRPTRLELEQIGQAAFDMSKTFGRGIGDILDSFKLWGQMGLRQADLMNAVNATMLASNAIGMDAKEVTEDLTAAIFAYGVETENLTAVTDKWMAVQRQYPVTAADLANSIKTVGAAANMLGVDIDNLNGIVAAIASVTRKSGREVGNSLKTMFARIPRRETVKAFQDIGVYMLKTQTEFRNLDDVLDDLAVTWDTLTDIQKVSIAQQVAGVRRYVDFVALMDNYQVKLKATATSQSALGETVVANDIEMQTYRKTLEALKNVFVEFSEALGGEIVPLLTSAAKAGTALFKALGNKYIAKVIAGISGLAFVFFSLKGTLIAGVFLMNKFGSLLVSIFPKLIQNTTALKMLSAAERKVAADAKLAGIEMQKMSYSNALIGAITLISALVLAFKDFGDSADDAADSFGSSVGDINKQIERLDETQRKVTSTKATFDTTQELINKRKELIGLLGEEKEGSQKYISLQQRIININKELADSSYLVNSAFIVMEDGINNTKEATDELTTALTRLLEVEKKRNMDALISAQQELEKILKESGGDISSVEKVYGGYAETIAKGRYEIIQWTEQLDRTKEAIDKFGTQNISVDATNFDPVDIDKINPYLNRSFPILVKPTLDYSGLSFDDIVKEIDKSGTLGAEAIKKKFMDEVVPDFLRQYNIIPFLEDIKKDATVEMKNMIDIMIAKVKSSRSEFIKSLEDTKPSKFGAAFVSSSKMVKGSIGEIIEELSTLQSKYEKMPDIVKHLQEVITSGGGIKPPGVKIELPDLDPTSVRHLREELTNLEIALTDVGIKQRVNEQIRLNILHGELTDILKTQIDIQNKQTENVEDLYQKWQEKIAGVTENLKQANLELEDLQKRSTQGGGEEEGSFGIEEANNAIVAFEKELRKLKELSPDFIDLLNSAKDITAETLKLNIEQKKRNRDLEVANRLQEERLSMIKTESSLINSLYDDEGRGLDYQMSMLKQLLSEQARSYNQAVDTYGIEDSRVGLIEEQLKGTEKLYYSAKQAKREMDFSKPLEHNIRLINDFRKALGAGLGSIQSGFLKSMEDRLDIQNEIVDAQYDLNEAIQEGEVEAILEAKAKLRDLQDELKEVNNIWRTIGNSIRDAFLQLSDITFRNIMDEVASDLTNMILKVAGTEDKFGIGKGAELLSAAAERLDEVFKYGSNELKMAIINGFDYAINKAEQLAAEMALKKSDMSFSEFSGFKETPYDDMINKYAKLNNLEPDFIKSVIKAESNFDPTAKNLKSSATGMMQLIKSTARDMGLKVNDVMDERLDAEKNIMAGSKYLAEQFNKDNIIAMANGDKIKRMELALAAYHAGPTAFDLAGGIPDSFATQDYVRKAMGFYSEAQQNLQKSSELYSVFSLSLYEDLVTLTRASDETGKKIDNLIATQLANVEIPEYHPTDLSSLPLPEPVYIKPGSEEYTVDDMSIIDPMKKGSDIFANKFVKAGALVAGMIVGSMVNDSVAGAKGASIGSTIGSVAAALLPAFPPAAILFPILGGLLGGLLAGEDDIKELTNAVKSNTDSLEVNTQALEDLSELIINAPTKFRIPAFGGGFSTNSIAINFNGATQEDVNRAIGILERDYGVDLRSTNSRTRVVVGL